jgi:hypothetical protein
MLITILLKDSVSASNAQRIAYAWQDAQLGSEASIHGPTVIQRTLDGFKIQVPEGALEDIRNAGIEVVVC